MALLELLRSSMIASSLAQFAGLRAFDEVRAGVLVGFLVPTEEKGP